MPYLEVETHEARWHVPLDRDRLTIGRLETNDVVLPYQHISRRHAEVRQVGDTWWIADLGSTNGMRVRGRPVSRHPLRLNEPVDLAPGIVLHLVAEAAAGDPSSMATTRMPSTLPAAATPAATAPSGLAAGLSAFAASGVRPLPRADTPGPPGTAARPEGRGADLHDAATPARPSTPTADLAADDLEGDLFRRTLRRGAPPRHAGEPSADPGASWATGEVPLHLCQTCGQLTAPDAVRCQSCHSGIARPCPVCDLSLLPIQDRCPRCQSVNPISVRRSRRGRGRMTG